MRPIALALALSLTLAAAPALAQSLIQGHAITTLPRNGLPTHGVQLCADLAITDVAFEPSSGGSPGVITTISVDNLGTGNYPPPGGRAAILAIRSVLPSGTVMSEQFMISSMDAGSGGYFQFSVPGLAATMQAQILRAGGDCAPGNNQVQQAYNFN